MLLKSIASLSYHIGQVFDYGVQENIDFSGVREGRRAESKVVLYPRRKSGFYLTNDLTTSTHTHVISTPVHGLVTPNIFCL